MRRRTSRRPGSQGQWFPNSIVPSANTQDITIGAGANATNQAFFALFDNQLDFPDTVAAGGIGYSSGLLSSVNRQSWMLKRLVGSIFVAVKTAAGSAVIATVGLVKVPTQADGSIAQTVSVTYNPFQNDSQKRRWLWRRSWMLGGNAGYPGLPFGNMDYSSLKEGSHIDSKMKVTVQYEERLQWVFGVANAGGTGGAATVTFLPQVRIFAKALVA